MLITKQIFVSTVFLLVWKLDGHCSWMLKGLSSKKRFCLLWKYPCNMRLHLLILDKTLKSFYDKVPKMLKTWKISHFLESYRKNTKLKVFRIAKKVTTQESSAFLMCSAFYSDDDHIISLLDVLVQNTRGILRIVKCTDHIIHTVSCGQWKKKVTWKMTQAHALH